MALLEDPKRNLGQAFAALEPCRTTLWPKAGEMRHGKNGMLYGYGDLLYVGYEMGLSVENWTK